MDLILFGKKESKLLSLKYKILIIEYYLLINCSYKQQPPAHIAPAIVETIDINLLFFSLIIISKLYPGGNKHYNIDYN